MPHLFLYQGSHKIIGAMNQPSSSGSAERTILLNQFEKQGWALPKRLCKVKKL